MSEQIVIILQDVPEKNKLPVTHIEILQDKKEFGDKAPKRTKGPMATALVREALSAYAGNIELIKKARELNISQDISFKGIVREVLQTAIRFKMYQQKKEQAGAAKPTKKAK